MSLEVDWKVAWVTGASSGIGRELALQLARAGVAVAASARTAETLDALTALHANIKPYPLDVTNRTAVTETAERISRDMGPIDLAILNAGIWEPMGAANFDAANVAKAMDVNYLGVANALEALLPGMVGRRAGHVALMGSIAGYRGLPKSITYAPTKAALISLAECLEHELRDYGVRVTIINPGFVETPLVRINKFPMPFIVTADDAAARIIRGLARGKYEIAFPWPMVWLSKFGRAVPNQVYFWITRTFRSARR